ncbi:MAG: hypothetical protein KAI17_10635 [Thiotrichaceae bacterium]|nr:hypothetical protein [Thiotrichaceae bacterium]
MKNIVLLWLMTLPLCVTGRILCWTNEDGILSCANSIPAQYAQDGYSEYDQKTGMKVNDVAPAPTLEEVAERQKQYAEKIRLEAELKKDAQFLDIFPSKRDIERARKTIQLSIDGQLHSIETILKGLRRNLKDLENSYKKSQTMNVAQHQLAAIQRNIKAVKQRVLNTADTLQKMHEKREDANTEYDDYLKRYMDIQRRRRPKKPE